MIELTTEQKEDLKRWEKQLHLISEIFIVWGCIMIPLLLFLSDVYGDGVWYINAGIVVVLSVVALYIRHHKKCPNCKTIISSGYRIISLPEKCNKCGIKFK